jgi:hypothetical protein
MQKQYNKKNKYQRDKWYSNTTTLLNIIIVLSIIDCSWLVLKVDNMIVNILLGLILADLLLITLMVFVIGKIIDERIK